MPFFLVVSINLLLLYLCSCILYLLFFSLILTF
nr:MAG TPA: hypothetical protein [Bacteriophage sp.]